MDSMRNLHKSLPGSAPQQGRKLHNPPEDILQSFRAAALSVTNLYKRAAEDLTAERLAGYQDAIFDLLSFLDKHNLGLETGEGWQIRQWATGKQETGSCHHQHNNNNASDEEEEKDEHRDDSNQVAEDETSQSEEVPVGLEAAGDMASSNASLMDMISRGNDTATSLQPSRAENFAFQGPLPYPETDMDLGAITPIAGARPTSAQTRQNALARTPRRRAQLQRQANRQRSLGAGAGAKRKVQYNDFFDLGGLNFEKDSNGGGTGGGSKRSRPL